MEDFFIIVWETGTNEAKVKETIHAHDGTQLLSELKKLSTIKGHRISIYRAHLEVEDTLIRDAQDSDWK